MKLGDNPKEKVSVFGTILYITIVILFVIAIGLLVYMFIGDMESGSLPDFSSCIGSNYNGTYYKYEGGQLNESNYVILKNGKWEDGDGLTGEYKIDNGEITIYLGSSGVPFLSGTIANGKLELEITSYSTMVYYKKGYEP